MPETDPLLERLHALEVSAEVQAEILIAIQAELIEADRLTASISRLGDGAGSLATALLQVDAQQQALSQLGLELARVEEMSATTEDVEEKVAAAKLEVDARNRAHRRRNLLWALVTLMVLLALTGLTAWWLHNERVERIAACEKSTRTTTAVVEFLDSVAENATVPEIKQSAQDVISALPTPDQLRPCR